MRTVILFAAMLFYLNSCATYQRQNHAPPRDHYMYSDVDSNTYMITMANGLMADTSYLYTKDNKPIEILVWGKSGRILDTLCGKKTVLGGENSLLLNRSELKAVDTARSTKSIYRIVTLHYPEVQFLYQDLLDKDKSFSGGLYFRFWVKPNGNVRYIYLLGNTTSSHEFGLQVLKMISKWKFEPKSGREDDLVNLPYNFTPSN